MAIIDLQRGIEVGSYAFRIVNVEDKMGPSGFPYLILSLMSITKGSAGIQHSEMVSLSPKAKFRLVQFLDSIKAPPKGKMNSTELIGKVAWATIEMQVNERNGKEEPKVKEWFTEPADAANWLASEEEILEGSSSSDEAVESVVANAISELESGEDADIPF